MKPQQKKGVDIVGPLVLGVSLTNKQFEKDESTRYRFRFLEPAPCSQLVMRAGERKILGIVVPNPLDKLPRW